MTPNIAPLRNVAALIGLIEKVQSRAFSLPGMAIFHGPSGWGKTTAVTIAANEFQAYCVQVKEHWTPTYLVQMIMQEIGLPPVRGVPAMVDAIGDHLLTSDRPLIVDDAQYLLQKKMLGLVRDIYESSQAPVILVGEEALSLNITRWENVHNRILEWQPAFACNISDAELLAPIYCKGVAVDAALLAEILGKSKGSIRRVAVNLSRVQELARSKGKTSFNLVDWGDRAFNTGQPPVRPRAEQAYAAASVVPLKRKGGAK